MFGAAAAAKSLQSGPTLCDPIDGSPSGILQARTLEWVAISFSNAGKWKWSRSVVSDSSPWPHGLQPTRLLHPWDFPGKSTGVGCHRVRWGQLCSSLSILWHCLSLGLEWKLTFSSPVATAEFPKFANILSAVLSQHHLLGFEIAQLGFITSTSFVRNDASQGPLDFTFQDVWL